MRDSLVEMKIYDILTDDGISFQEEYEFPDLVSSSGRKLRFDFAVFTDDGKLDFLIEFNGKQHYTPVAKYGGSRGVSRQKYNDIQKRKYCLDHNIRLVTIPYYEENKISYDYIMRMAGH